MTSAVARISLRDAAVEYSRLGWSVIPLRPREKRPDIRSWAKYQQQAASVEQVQRYWERHPDANIGIVTGAVSGLVVLDVDGDAGRKSLRGRHLPMTPVVETGRGFHYYFAHPGGEIRTCKPAPGLDLKAEGGYVVAPPSAHPSGRQYRWSDGLSPYDVPLAPCPEWLLEQARADAPRRTPEEWAAIIREGAVPGDRHPTLAQLAGHLLGKRVDPRVVLELLLAWNQARCRPPKPTEEIVDIVRYLWRRDMERGRSA